MAKRGNGEGSIYRRKSDGKWVGSISLNNGERKVIYGKSRAEVQEKMKVLLRDQQQGMLITEPNQTVEQFLTQWVEDRKPSVRIRTYERYEAFVRLHVIPVIGRVKMQQLNPQHIKGLYARKLKEGLSPTTVNTLHMMLHKAFDDAVKWNIVARNVCDMVDVPQRAHYEMQPLTVEQAKRFLEAAKGHALEALFVLALTTGLRRGEILALKWSDIDFEKQTVQVKRIFTRAPGNRYIEAEPKTKKSKRSVKLITKAVDLLKQHRIRQQEEKGQAGPAWTENNLVFCTSLGTPLNPSKLLERFDTLLKKAGLQHMRFHDLRHSAATILLAMNVHPKIVQELLGHNQISMTMDLYSHVLPGLQEEVIGKLEDVLGQSEDDKDGENDQGMGVPVG